MASKCCSKRKSHTLNQTLERTELSEEVHVESEASCTKQLSCGCKGNVLEGNQKCHCSEHTKRNSTTIDMEEVLVV